MESNINSFSSPSKRILYFDPISEVASLEAFMGIFDDMELEIG